MESFPVPGVHTRRTGKEETSGCVGRVVVAVARCRRYHSPEGGCQRCQINKGGAHPATPGPLDQFVVVEIVVGPDSNPLRQLA